MDCSMGGLVCNVYAGARGGMVGFMGWLCVS